MVIISGTTTENGCHATARDAMFRNYRVVFLSDDAAATYDYPDRGFGPMPNTEVHLGTLASSAIAQDGRRKPAARTS
jgi:nicotinamidase-related amidase